MVPEVAVSPQNPEAQPIRTGSGLVDLLQLQAALNFEEQNRKNVPLNGVMAYFSECVPHKRSRKCCLYKWTIRDIIKML